MTLNNINQGVEKLRHQHQQWTFKKPELYEFLYRINLSADGPEGISFTHADTHIYDKAFQDPEAP